MGEKSEEILTQIMPTITASTTFDRVKERFDSYFRPKRNAIFERYKFNSRIQEPGESVDSFVTALYSLAETCEYDNIRDEFIRDRIVIGIRDTRASERLQLMSNLWTRLSRSLANQRHNLEKERR